MMPMEDWWPFFKGLCAGIVIGVVALVGGVLVHVARS
jgi:hypothetical protein